MSADASPAERVHAALTGGQALRDAYGRGTVLGTFLIELPTPRTVRGLALAGFDFVVLDLEHSPFGIEGLVGLVAEAQAVGVPTLVRVAGLDPGAIGKVLDLGVCGVMIPHVRDVNDAAEAVRCARYAPLGERGVAPLIGHAAAWTVDGDAGGSVLVVVQIEGPDAVDHAAEIAATPGVDGVFVGPFDLAQAIGAGRDVESPGVLAAAERVAGEAEGHTMLGIYVDEPARSRAWSERGFRLQCVGFDGRMLLDGAKGVLSQARGASGDA
jgi:2-keto-3-deoxy-L-rhamnonate aldolase RhmA